MKADEHLRAALRHAPDADLQAPVDLRAQIVAAAHRAAAEPAPGRRRPAPRPSWWAAFNSGAPLRLGASGALATVLLAGVLGLIWQGEQPGPDRDLTGDAPEPAAAAPEVAAAPTMPPTRPAPKPDAAMPAKRPAAGGAGARQAEQTLGAADRRLVAAAPAPAPAPAAIALPPPAVPPTPSAVPAPAAPPDALPPIRAEVAEAPERAALAPAMARPAPRTQGVADSASTNAAGWRNAPARVAVAAAPAPLPGNAMSAATLPAPWAALLVDTVVSRWRVDGLDLPVDGEWLRSLFQQTRGRWAPAPAAEPQPDDLQLDWLQGDTSGARLWLGRTQVTWCTAAQTCQSAPLPESAATALKDTLKKKLPR